MFIIGSERKKATYQAVRELEQNLKQYEEIDFEYIFLSDYNLGFCQGCKLCFDKGEGFSHPELRLSGIRTHEEFP